MQRQSFNQNWTFREENGEAVSVTLPHDAQIGAARSKDAPGGSGHGYFTGGRYIYTKEFDVPSEWSGRHSELLFEGVYRNAEVFVNGEKAGEHRYGYTPFTVVLDGVLKFGEKNTLEVRADNSELPNSRWYSGGGIYRPVWLLQGGKTFIPWQGVKVRTLSADPAEILVTTETGGDAEGAVASVSVYDGDTLAAQGGGSEVRLAVPGAKLWSDENPHLYRAEVRLTKDGVLLDETEVTFGIRGLSWSPQGFFVNGVSTLLRGGCIHHDNGVIGAVSFKESELRKVRILKESGFNAVRISHNPASTALLEACDELGMYVMDEAFDMWYNRKNLYDYGRDFETCWREDITAMVTNDYNHPSVIMYSIGNEVAEPHEQRGLDAGKAMISLIHALDPGRPVTCGLNLMVLSRAAKGQGIYQDGKQNTGSDKPQKEKKATNGSLAFNIMASFIGTGMNKGGNSPKVDALASPFCDALDIVGYNYGSGRYPLDGKAHPDRILVGSETFPQDICRNWAMVKKFPYLVGDFMWTAWDYLGEAGIGAWSYTGGMPFNRPYPWLLAGAGVIDILGVPDASCRYAATVWGEMKHPVIGVRPVNHPGVRVSKSVWRGTNAVESWAWQNCSGFKAEIEVYSDEASVELFLNGKSLGRKKLRDFKAFYKTAYEPGELKAVAYDASGKAVSEHTLTSAEGRRSVAVLPEKDRYEAGEIAYVNVVIRGENGVVEYNDDRKLKAAVSGAELIGFGSANPRTEESYTSGEFTTYYGRAQAVVRVLEPGKARVTVSDGKEECEARL